MAGDLQVMIVAHGGRLEAEALLFAASCAAAGQKGLIVATPLPGPNWPLGRELTPAGRRHLEAFGAEIRPFAVRHFGDSYPNGLKIEALRTLDLNRPFVAFDTDTVLLASLDGADLEHAPPGAREDVEPTWPRPGQGRRGRRAVWTSLYDLFDLPVPDPAPYFCAARVHGPCAQQFASDWMAKALAIRDTPPLALQGQALYPWLDQIALPLALATLGGGPDPARAALLDRSLSHHYRSLALAYARAPDRVLQLIERLTAEPSLHALLCRHAPFQRVLSGGGADAIRADRTRHPIQTTREKPFRKKLKALGYWDR